MKKVFMTLAVVLMGVTAANAQLVIGGNVALGGVSGSKTTTDGKITSIISNDYQGTDHFNFGFAPKIGYQLMDGKMEVGVAIALNYALETGYGEFEPNEATGKLRFGTNPIVKDENAKKLLKTGQNHDLSLGVSPYARYFFLQKGIFSLGVQGQFNLGGSFVIAPKVFAVEGKILDGVEYEDYKITQEEADEYNKTFKDMIKDVKPSYFNYGIYVMPVMKFDLTEHCYMDITLNAIGLYAAGSLYSCKEMDEKDEYTIKSKTSSFNGGFTGLRGDAFSVGFAYKF